MSDAQHRRLRNGKQISLKLLMLPISIQTTNNLKIWILLKTDNQQNQNRAQFSSLSYGTLRELKEICETTRRNFLTEGFNGEVVGVQ